tara:strand:+ start:2369 stop:3313 length:945 start_codon:yes stop_codon:yes gene_type:complete
MKTYKASSINECKTLQSVRNNYDLFSLSKQVNKRGDWLKLSRSLNINRYVLCRAIEEAKILSNYPNILKSKTAPLSRLKTNKEKELFFDKYDIDKISVRGLYKLVNEWKNSLEENPRLLLTEQQHDLVVGSALGDSNIRQRDRNCSFRVGHSKKQEKYLRWKYDLLKEFTNLLPSWSKRKINNHIVETLNFSTLTHSVFNFYYKLFYKEGKKTVTRKLLDMLTPRSLAIWICDDGSFDNKQGYVVLCTNSFSLKEHNTIKKYFKEVWNLDPKIGFRDKKYYYLRFKQNDTKELIKIISPFIPKFMKYKIGEENE